MTASSAILTGTLAQAPRAVELAGRARPSVLDLYPYALPVAGVAACVGTLAYLGWRAASERSADRTPSDRRLSKVGRRLGLTRADLEVLRRLSASHGQAEPAALLVSRHAFRESVSAFAGGIVTPSDRDRAIAIGKAIGCDVADLFATDRPASTKTDRAGKLLIARRRAAEPGERRLSA